MSKTSSDPAQGMFLHMPEKFKPFDLTRVESTWRPPDPSTWPDFAAAKRVGVDTEFRDAELLTLGVGYKRDPKTHYMTGVSIAIEDGPSVYLPFAHEGGDNLDRESVMAYLKHNFKNFKGDLVGANLPCDLNWLWESGIDMPGVHRFYDVQVADPLLYELERSYRLNDIAKRRGFGGKSEDLLIEAARVNGCDPKGDMWQIPARYVGPYATDDGVLPLKILRKQERDIEDQGISDVWDMESRLLPILVRMGRKGVRVNMDRVDQMERWAHAREQAAWDVVKRETGVQIPLGQSMNVGLLTAALRKAGLDDCIGTNTRGDSVTKELLASIKHPVAQAISDARKMAKLCSTYVNGTRKAAIITNGEARIHCTFNQIRKTEDDNSEDGASKGVAYGRLSCSNPNMQNQPAADRLTGENLMGCMWRSVYMAEVGEEWNSNDLKQQEPRWSFHYGAMLEEMRKASGEQRFPDVRGALELCAKLNADPMLDCYQPLVEMTGKSRSVCKTMWLARAYGKGNGKMCDELGYPTEDYVFVPRKMKSVPVNSEQGQEAIQMDGHVIFTGAGQEGLKVIDDFDNTMPFLKATAKLAQARANELGYVTLISKRRCHFEKIGSQYDSTNKAFNRLIQGTAAEQMKRTMLAVDEAGFGAMLMLQVHDELAASVANRGVALEIANVMKTAMPMKVPTVVDTEIGTSWGESMFLEEIIDGKKIKRQYVWDLG